MKRIFSLFLVLCMVVTLLPAGSVFTASAAAGGGDLSFDLLSDFTQYATANNIVAVDGSNIANAPTIKSYRLAPTYGWSAGNLIRNSANDWLWTQSASTRGLFFKSDVATNSYNSIAVDITAAGAYRMDVNAIAWSGGGKLVMYLVPVTSGTMNTTIEQVLNGAYAAKSNVFELYNSVEVERTGSIPYVELAAGTYQVVFYQTAPCTSGAAMPGYFIKNINFTSVTPITGVTISNPSAKTTLVTGESIQLSASVTPNIADYQNVTWISSNPHIASVDANGKVTATGLGSVIITAQSASPSKSASITINAHANSTIYSYKTVMEGIKGNSVGSVTGADNVNGNAFVYIRDYATATWPHNWQAGGVKSHSNNQGEWIWTSSARIYGIYFAAMSENAYNSIDILVPQSGYYKVISHHTKWSAGGNVKMYLAPKSADYDTVIANAVAESEPISHFGQLTAEETANGTEVVVDDYVYLTAGNHTVLYSQVDDENATDTGKGYFVRGLHLERYPDVTGVEFAWESLNLALGETRELISEVYPVGVLQDVEYSSADPSVVEVTDDGKMIAKKHGVTTITATSVADRTKKKTITVTVGAKSVYYDYRTKNSKTTLDVDGWEINHDVVHAKAGFEWVETSRLSETYGLFFGNVFGYEDASDGAYVSVNVRVPVDGIYQVSSVYPIWQHGGIMDVYIVEAWQAEDFLTEGTKLNLDAVETRNDPNDKSNVKTVETLHEIEVALDADTEYTIVYVAKTIRQGFYLLGTRLTELNCGYRFVEAAPSLSSGVSADVKAQLLWSAEKGVMTSQMLWKWTPSSSFAGLYLGGQYGGPVSGTASNGDYAGINVEIPFAGWYEIGVDYYAFQTGGSMNLYALTWEASTKPNYKDNSTLLNNEPINTQGALGEVHVNLDNKYYFAAPGKYTIAVELADVQDGVYLCGVDFTPVLYVDEVIIDEEETVILEDEAEQYDVSATVRSDVAKNPEINWSSSDETVATVENGTISFLKNGHVAITAEAADGSGIKKVIHFLRGYGITYNYNFRESLKPIYDAYGKQTTLNAIYTPTEDDLYAAEANAFAEGYEASVAAGSAPWMYAGGTKKISYSISTSSGYGLFVDYGSPGDYAQLKLRVDENGRYHMVFNFDRWKTSSGAFDLFLAPINATNPTADRWKIHSYTPEKNNEELRNEVYLGTRTLPEGEYYFTLKYKDPSDNKLIGFSNFKLLKYDNLGKYTIEGAQVRLAGTNAFGTVEEQGLRFISWISKDLYPVDSAKVKEFGTVLVPSAVITNIDDLKIGAVLNGYAVAKVPAVNRYVDTGDHVLFTAVVTRLKEAHYNMSITARAYVIYEDAEGVEHTIYGDTYTERSIYEVAQNGINRGGLSEQETEVFQTIVNTVKNTK
ncbi:MAG: Ig-like domain-containing protein [Oscillospiraceae bacterium]|nr:Ig-like domain-containing protein [Oscillospiraceae bacterium]